ncbi:MAG TPA: DUF924 domain-containing protein [Thauera sp.]|nr:DUF924 domain-containing protein [Thauera sp.]
MDTPDSIHAFWFGPDADTTAQTAIIERQSALWWRKQAEVDADMRQRFAALVGRAGAGELDGWLGTLRGRLALILLTDQFPRNIWRGQAAAFAFDVLALRWARDTIRLGLDLDARPIERVFLYLPLEHSEDLADQREAVRLFDVLASGLGAAERPAFDGYVDYARRHLEIIDRFGRFPHRNAALGRKSTADEVAFLQQPGSGF